MSHKYKTLPSNTTSQLPSSRASLPVLNARRRLINRPTQSSVMDAEYQHSPPPSRLDSLTVDPTPLSPHIPIAPPRKSTVDLQRSSSPANSLTTNNSSSNKDISTCLKNVTVCLDIRTEDGSDVSQNFVKVVKSMGAQIRKTVAGDVTHLVYKGGSAANVKKALHNKCKIVSLLWITNCKSEGRRVPEDKYLIENPENLVLAGAKRRKSMEPGRVKALILDDSSSFEDKRSNNNTNTSKRFKSPATTSTSTITAATARSMITVSQRRKTASHWETSAIIPREATHSHHDAVLKSDMSLELGDLNFDFGDTANETPPSSPVTSDRLLQYQQRRRKTDQFARTEQPALSRSMRRLSFKDDPNSSTSSSVVSQKPQVKKEIKAGFYIGTPSSPPPPPPPQQQQQQQQQSQTSSTSPSSSSTTTATLPPSSSSHTTTALSTSALSTSLPSLSSSNPMVIRRRRRSLSNRAALASPPPSTTTTTTSAFSRLLDKSKSSPLSSPPPPPKQQQPTSSGSTKQTSILDHLFSDNHRFPTIAMTSMNEQTKKQCTKIINKLGKYRVTSSVDETTTHVIVGCQRRTESVILGLLNGAWLVTPDWILESNKSKGYLNESTYEAILFFPRARAARRHDPLLPSTINIYIHSTSKALAGGLVQQLIIKAGGHVVESMKDADIIISTISLDLPITTVTENWLLDSIEQWRYLSTNRYHPPSS